MKESQPVIKCYGLVYPFMELYVYTYFPVVKGKHTPGFEQYMMNLPDGAKHNEMEKTNFIQVLQRNTQLRRLLRGPQVKGEKR